MIFRNRSNSHQKAGDHKSIIKLPDTKSARTIYLRMQNAFARFTFAHGDYVRIIIFRLNVPHASTFRQCCRTTRHFALNQPNAQWSSRCRRCALYSTMNVANGVVCYHHQCVHDAWGAINENYMGPYNLTITLCSIVPGDTVERVCSQTATCSYNCGIYFSHHRSFSIQCEILWHTFEVPSRFCRPTQ